MRFNIIFLFLFIVFACDSKKKLSLDEKQKKLVEVDLVKMKQVSDKINFVGQVEGTNKISVYPDSNISGLLVKRLVDEGSRVNKGQILMKIDQRLTTGYKYLNFKVRSKINGVVLQIYPEVGDVITSSTKLVQIAKIDKVKIVLDIPQSYISKLVKGQIVNILAENVYPDIIFEGFVSHIYPIINPQTLSLRIEVIVDNDKFMLKPGMFVKSEIVLQENTKILIPLQSLIIENNIRYVYIYDKNSQTVIKSAIVVGKIYNKYIEVKEGLNVGDMLVVEGNYQVRDNEKVNVRVIQ